MYYTVSKSRSWPLSSLSPDPCQRLWAPRSRTQRQSPSSGSRNFEEASLASPTANSAHMQTLISGLSDVCFVPLINKYNPEYKVRCPILSYVNSVAKNSSYLTLLSAKKKKWMSAKYMEFRSVPPNPYGIRFLWLTRSRRNVKSCVVEMVWENALVLCQYEA